MYRISCQGSDIRELVRLIALASSYCVKYSISEVVKGVFMSITWARIFVSLSETSSVQKATPVSSNVLHYVNKCGSFETGDL